MSIRLDALGSGAGSSRRDQFLMELLETPPAGVHGDVVDDEAQLSSSTRSPHAVVKNLAQGSRARSGEAYFSMADGDISHSQCLEFLCRKGPGLLIKNLKDKETICSLLLNMADIVKVLPPPDEPLPRDILNMTLWKSSLWALVQEMKTVEENFPSLIGNSCVYVLTASPYSAFLRALAAEIADRRS